MTKEEMTKAMVGAMVVRAAELDMPLSEEEQKAAIHSLFEKSPESNEDDSELPKSQLEYDDGLVIMKNMSKEDLKQMVDEFKVVFAKDQIGNNEEGEKEKEEEAEAEVKEIVE